MIRFLVDQNNFAASYNSDLVLNNRQYVERAEERHPDDGNSNKKSANTANHEQDRQCLSPSETYDIIEERFIHTLTFAESLLPVRDSRQDEHNQMNHQQGLRQKELTTHIIPFLDDDKKDLLIKEEQESTGIQLCNEKCSVPIISLCNIMSADHLASFHDHREGRTNDAHQHAFEEGTSAFASPIVLSILELDSLVQEDGDGGIQDYSSKTFIASLLFNLGVCKARKSDYHSAKNHFRKALDLILDIDQSFLQRETAAIREHIFVTLASLTVITLLNLGHTDWHLNNSNGSINFYNQCLSSLQVFYQHVYSLSSENIVEELQYCKYTTAACLNCIGMVFLNNKLITSSLQGASKEQIKAEGEICLKYLEKGLDIFEEIESDNDDSRSLSITANMTTVLNNLGRVYFIMGDYEQALYHFQGCLGRRMLSLPHRDLDLGVAYFNVARTMQTLGIDSEALENYRSYLSIVTPILGHADKNIVKAILFATDIYIDMEDFDEAESLLQEYLSSLAFASIENVQSKSTLLNALSKVFCCQDKIASALKSLFQVRDIILTLPESRKVMSIYVANSSNIAKILAKNGNLEQALDMYQQALKKLSRYEEEQVGQPLIFPDLLVELHMNIARTYERLNDITSAIFHVEQVIFLEKKIMKDTDYKISAHLNYLGLVYCKANKYGTALSTFTECLVMCSQCESAKTSEIVAILFNIAAVHKAIGESDKALDAFLKVLHHERDLHQREGSTFDAKDLILTLMHIFEIYDREFGIPRDGMEYLLEAATLCKEYNKSIDNTLGRYVFFSLGDVLSSNQETTEGFKCYCEGCKLFGTMDTDDILAFGKKGVHMILAQMCNDNRVFPVHAAAA